ncbi:MAG TPA: type I-U CRISPR-associated protein Csx17 [Bryobacteraceae bacterium]|jgi:CRISPR-associated protein Csx17|nr:type I-U CRISPR-associated protein Csx17 [Bryobacteraceae bacterium]
MTLELTGCPFQPLAAYLKALAVLRLATQEDENARGFWNSRHFVLESNFDREGLVQFFLTRYRPTPVLAPWNGGSGFYKEGTEIVKEIAASDDLRFEGFRKAIAIAKQILKRNPVEPEATSAQNKENRATILRECRNWMSDASVDWLDAAAAIASDESRAIAPILGTGGNEAHLDYTNNFMQNLAMLLLRPKKAPVRALLENALFNTLTGGLQKIAVGQYDPGRCGGANQGNGIEAKSVANPWNAVLTVEGAIAWAGGIYRKQGVSYRSLLCSPFTVKASVVGYSSAAEKDQAATRAAEIWTPIWENAARYEEIRALLREGRAAVNGSPAQTGLEFAEAAALLGVDRAISAFVRYSLVERRGDSYIALPNGKFPVQYRSTADRVREIVPLLDHMQSLAKGSQNKVPNSWPPLVRALEEAMFQALLHGNEQLLIQVAGAFGAMCRWLILRSKNVSWHERLSTGWIEQCTKICSEARIAAALAGIGSENSKGLLDNITPEHTGFCWIGRDLPARMLATLRRRTLDHQQSDRGPFWSKTPASVNDVVAFLEYRTNDELIENLTFAFVFAKTAKLGGSYEQGDTAYRRWPAYCMLKQLFAPETHRGIDTGAGKIQLRPALSITALIAANRVKDAVEAAIRRLRISGLEPLLDSGWDLEDGARLGAALLIPIFGSDTKRLREFITKPRRVIEV